MTNELTIEKNNILAYLTDNIDGLGYEERTIHQATKDLFIKSDLLKQIKHPNNLSNFKTILKRDFNNDENAFYKSFKQQIKNKLNSKQCLNVAFLLNEEFLFKGKYFTLFNKHNLLSPDSCSFKDNTFSVIAEYTHKLINTDNDFISGADFRPDLIFFINGIYFSYQELKFLSNGQNAKEHGTYQIIEKYYNSYQHYEEQVEKLDLSTMTKEKRTKERAIFKKDFLRIFSSPIHISSFDSQNLYVIRSFADMEMRLKNIKKDDRVYKKTVFFQKSAKEFKKVPSAKDFKEYLYMLFSKELVEREILYYNMVEKAQKEVTRKYGKKEFANKQETGTLISPRPKQKYGVDKTIKLIKEVLANENNPDYWINKTREKIKNLPEDVQEEIIQKHTKFKNNKYIDSILLAYAAGFGKTNIIGWLSLLIKDIVQKEVNKRSYAYNTIFLITDRIELKDQINQKMRQMNVEKGLVVEVKDSKSFKEVIRKNTKIVIINIQKFTNIKKLFDSEEVMKLQESRSVFIIDEIHRSNSGSQHDDMMSLFSQMFNGSENIKKNLLIGLTATPTEEVLLRFGEYSGCDGNGNIIYQPHDSYTMQESIDDGFTLPFHNKMTPIAISMRAFIKDNQNDSTEDKKVENSKKEIYENERRCEFVSKTIVKQLFNNVYRKILVGKGGKYQGKAMLACYSIEAAILHYKYIKEEIERLSDEVIDSDSSTFAEKELYRYYKKTGVYIVYSDSENKSLPKAREFNGANERTTIHNFKNNRNGIMIVVDKLQTGFDEKKIHTLFLNTEKTGIGLIQLLSRANRTTKGKGECHIIDFSHNNINTFKNLPKAWKSYGGSIYANTDVKTPIETLETAYITITTDGIFWKEYKKDYVKMFKNPNLSNQLISLEGKICTTIKDNLKESEELRDNIYLYFNTLELLDRIIDIDSKYQDSDLKLFLKKLLNLFKNCEDSFSGETIKIGYEFEEGGNIIEEPFESSDSDTSEANYSEDPKVDLIELFNRNEELKKHKIEDFEKWLKLFLDFIKLKSREEEKVDLITKIKNKEDNEELLNILQKLIRKAKRYPKLKREIPGEFFEIFEKAGKQSLLAIIVENARS